MNTRLQTLGASVRANRKARGLSVPQLAARCKMTKSNLWKIEQGRGNPCVTTLAKLANTLKCTFTISPKVEMSNERERRNKI